ncbi:MAG: pyruvate dehydrogenase (acetyl-transferring) E1 component subunit alpha, partial [Proteobacteria bacterium]
VMNMAATWDLPVLFIIENNKYGMGTDITRTTSVDALWKRALAFDMAHSDCDGMNANTVLEHVSGIIETMRKDKKPHLLEALTYRYRGHSVSDPGTYRTKDEVEDYQKNRDPILGMGKYLVENKFATEEDLKGWDNEAKEAAKAAEAFADESPEPAVEELWDHVLAP